MIPTVVPLHGSQVRVHLTCGECMKYLGYNTFDAEEFPVNIHIKIESDMHQADCRGLESEFEKSLDYKK
jgi:hypothetical protein